MSNDFRDLPEGLISSVKDVLKTKKDLYGDDLRNKYSLSPEPEAEAPEVPEAEPEENKED